MSRAPKRLTGSSSTIFRAPSPLGATGRAQDSVVLRPARRRSLGARIYRSRLHYLFILPTFILLAVFMYYPALSALVHSLYDWDGFTSPTFVGLANFVALAGDPLMQAAVVNVLKLAAFGMAVTLTMPLLVARLIFGLRSKRLQYVFRILFVIPLILPGVVILLIWQFLYDPNFGVLNSIITGLHLGQPQGWLGDPNEALIALMVIGFPWVDSLSLLIFTAGLQSISPELLEAADIDGAGALRRFFTVEFPLVMGQVKLVLILSMIGAIQQFTYVLILTQGGPGTATMVPGLVLYKAGFENERMGYACAIGTVMFGIMLILTYINMKYVRSRTDFEPVAERL
jgi:raffinose/stachyose/melibiose transport system permease protein